VSADLLAEAKSRLPLSRLMADFGLSEHAKKSARCPFHEDNSASFSVYRGADGADRWKCHAGCGQGDAVDFLARKLGLSNHDACKEFIRLAGVAPLPAPPRPGVPASGPASSATPPSAAPRPPFDGWPACNAAFTADHAAKLAAWRGYSPEFVSWLHHAGLVGIFDGERIALPVHDAQGTIIGCHYRRKEDGSWRYHPTGTPTFPLVVVDLASAQTVWGFESPWDMLAALDLAGWHSAPDGLPGVAAIATRGAENGKRLAGLVPPGATLVLFPQTDEPKPGRPETPAQKWTRESAAAGGCKTVLIVPTPSGFKNLNDALRAGLTPEEFRASVAAAAPYAPPAAPTPDLHAAPPRRVSNSPVVLPEEDSDDEPTAAEFPLDALPPVMACMVVAVASCEHVPPALPALAAIGVASASIGAGLEVVSGPNRVTRGNLFLLGAAESDSGKSETFRVVAGPLLDHQSRLLEAWRTKTSPELQSELRVLDKEIGSLEKKAAKAGDPSERERLRGELEYKLARKDDLARKAAMPCVMAQDVTTEKLAVLLRDNAEVVFSASADARKVVQNLMGRYNALQTSDESLYLSGYSGDFVRVDRQGRDAVVLHRPCLSLCWLVQPDLLATMLGEESLSASGFLPRLLICDTRAKPQRIENEAPALPEAIRAAWWKLVADLLASYHDAATPFRVEPTPAALACLTEFHNAVVDRRIGDLADVGAFAARYAENAWRLAVTFHAALYGADAHSHPLDAETAANAVRVVEWFAAAQLEILSKARRQAASNVEDEVLDLLASNYERKRQDFTTAREVQRARITADADSARALLARMADSGLLSFEDITPPNGGKPTRVFRSVRNPIPE
jgi:hypothetical protein